MSVFIFACAFVSVAFILYIIVEVKDGIVSYKIYKDELSYYKSINGIATKRFECSSIVIKSWIKVGNKYTIWLKDGSKINITEED